MITVGIDVHKNTCVASFLDTGSGELRTVEFCTTKPSIESFAKETLKRDMLVGLEATSNSFFVASMLKKYVDRVVMVVPEKHNDGIKTDKRDAKRIAISLAQGTYKACWIPSVSVYNLRQLIKHWKELDEGINETINRIRALLMGQGITILSKDLSSKKGREELQEKIEGNLPLELLLKMQFLIESLDLVEKQKEELDLYLAKIAQDEPLVRQLLTIPGVSVFSALAILAEIGDITRFPSPKQLVQYAGLAPSLYQSGNERHLGRITKRGRKILRWVLVQVANNAVRTDGRIRDFYLRLRGRNKERNKVIVACARKILCIIWYMLTRGEIYRDCLERLYRKKERMLEKKAENCPTFSPSLISLDLVEYLAKEKVSIPIGEAEILGKEVKKT